ncbi:hypothetical protein TI05_18525, partial [Achromatium sp. WMS3]
SRIDDAVNDANTRSQNFAQGLRETLTNIDTQIRSELDAIRKTYEDVVMRLEIEKISNADLSAMFTGLAMQLKGDFSIDALQTKLGSKPTSSQSINTTSTDSIDSQDPQDPQDSQDSQPTTDSINIQPQTKDN